MLAGVVEGYRAAGIDDKAGPLVGGQRLWMIEGRGMKPKAVERSRPGLIDCRLQQVGAEPTPDKVGNEPEITEFRLARRRGVELELWLSKNEQAWPARLIVTYRSLPGAPNFVALFSDWNFDVMPIDADFVFQPPAGAEQVALKPPAAPPPAGKKKASK